jgi:hypothetical protein
MIKFGSTYDQAKSFKISEISHFQNPGLLQYLSQLVSQQGGSLLPLVNNVAHCLLGWKASLMNTL